MQRFHITKYSSSKKAKKDKKPKMSSLGAFKLYHNHPEIRHKQNKNAFKIPVAEDVLETVRRNFTREIEFYEFCRQRLDRQHESLSKT